MWYLLNCVATQELDLLYQVKEVCAGHPDAVRFVVPTEKKTRSHGAKKMVTETKVKYQGYVFAKIRLCADLYERIQELDLLRSWMGTVNHKGYKKLPPVPLALNELEVEKFGLEEWEDEEETDEVDQTGVIVDIDDEDDMKSKIDETAVKAFQGIKVEDMVKVTAKGKFYDEEGIVRRLKDGKIMVRFYTYGTMFEEWMNPGDVRKLTELEVLRGLSGPTQPITQEQFDRPKGGRDQYNSPRQQGGLGGPNQRNRRQDRNANRFGRDRDDNVDKNRNERNWNWYQEQQQQRAQGGTGRTGEGYMRGGSAGKDDWVLGDVDSQWGRGKTTHQRGQQRETRQPRKDNRRAQAALDGDDDWSAFVSPAGKVPAGNAGEKDDADDFFASLMSDLSKDLDTSKQDQGSNSAKESQKRPVSDTTEEDGDFFDSLMAELSDEPSPSPVASAPTERSSPPLAAKKTPPPASNQDEDFFAALEAELGGELADTSSSSSASSADASDDFFAQLEAELSPPDTSDSTESAGKVDDFFNDMFGETTTTTEAPKKPARSKAPKAEPVAKQPTAAVQETVVAPPAASGNLDKCTIPVLKDMLRERGLKVSGKKAELIERLTQQQ